MDNITLLNFQSVAEVLGWTILHSLWQITIIALILKLLLVWTSKHDATIRYALGISALFVATFWSGHTFSEALAEVNFTNNQSVENIATSDATLLINDIVINHSPSTFSQRIEVQSAQIIAPLLPFLAIFWFIGILFFASRILVGLFRLHHLSNHGIQVLPNTWSPRLLTLQQLSGIQRPIKVRLSHLVESPITYQFFRPIILLPISLFTHLSDEQIEVLLLHELAHIKRNDYVVNLLQSVIEVLFFYHPLIWWMSKQVRLEREHCCDDRVMNLRHNPMLYAQTLTQIQGQHYSHKTKLAMSATGNKGDFSKRIYRLFQQKEPSATLRNSVAAVFLLLLSGGMMAFYPNHSTPIINNTDTSEIVQDTVPKKLSKISSADLKKEVKLEVSPLKTQESKKLTNNPPEIHRVNASKDGNDASIKTQQLVVLNGKILPRVTIYEPIILPNTMPEDIVLDRTITGEAAIQKYGEEGRGGVIEIYTKGNEPKATGNSLILKNNMADKKPLVVVDGKVSKQAVEDMDPDNIATINVKGEVALEKYGGTGKGDLIEIFTKENESKEQSSNKNLKEKTGTHQFDSKSTVIDKKPLIVLNGKITQKNIEDISPEIIDHINVMKEEQAIDKYGEQAIDGVLEVYTKAHKSRDDFEMSGIKVKIIGNTSTTDSPKEKKSFADAINAIDKIHKVQPLFIVDGKKRPVKGTTELTIEGLDPNEIAFMSFLKGENAIEKYGEEGANGVVEIITKKSGIKTFDMGSNIATITAKRKENKVQPLFVVDGKKRPVKGTTEVTIEDLDPNEIAFINVLKDEAALEKYGEEGKNGVIEIITKANKKGVREHEKAKKARKKEKKQAQKKKTKKDKQLAEKRKQKEVVKKKETSKVQKSVPTKKVIPSSVAGLSVFPNPTRQLTNIQLNLEQKGKVKVDILNINGQVVLHLVNDTLDKGLHQFQWNSNSQPAGSYFVHFNLDGVLMSKQVVVKK